MKKVHLHGCTFFSFAMPQDTRQIIPSKSGDDTLTINSVYIHSKYNPKADGINQKYRENSIVVVFGIGLGYHILNLTANNPSCFFIVYEIHRSLFDRFKNFLKHNQSAETKNILLLDRLDFDTINRFVETNCKAGSSRLFFYQNAYCNLYPQICCEYQDYIKKIYEFRHHVY